MLEHTFFKWSETDRYTKYNNNKGGVELHLSRVLASVRNFPGVCICMCVFLCMCVYVCVCIVVCVYVCVHMCVHMCVYMCVYWCLCVSMCVCIYMCMCVYWCVYVCTCVCVYVCMCVYCCVYVCVCFCPSNALPSWYNQYLVFIMSVSHYIFSLPVWCLFHINLIYPTEEKRYFNILQ